MDDSRNLRRESIAYHPPPPLYLHFAHRLAHDLRGPLELSQLFWGELEFYNSFSPARPKHHRHTQENILQSILPCKSTELGMILFLSSRMLSIIAITAAEGA
jgi:hypothetical protein